MPAVVLGIGVGILLLIFVWSLTVLVCVLTCRSSRSVAVLALVAAASISALLLSFPTSASRDNTFAELSLKEEGAVYDHLYIGRILLLLLLLVSATAGLSAIVSLHYQQPRLTTSIIKKHALFSNSHTL